MRILVLGGSVFLGHAFVTDAQRRGHEVTVFNRGRSGPAPAGAEVVHGDREVDDDLKRLVTGRSWDAVIDTCGFQPRTVGRSARALSGHAGGYLFVSSVHAHADWPAGPVSESSPRHACAADADPDSVPGNALKAGCERALEEHYGGGLLVLNCGLIVGPRENTGRLLWWLERAARGGRILAPGGPGRPMQLIDARDIARFGLDRLAAGDTGRYVVTAPVGSTTFAGLLGHCVSVTGSRAETVWADERFLRQEGVAEWTGLPLWALDGPSMAGTWLASPRKALDAGLRPRPLAETVRDTWQWLRARGPATGPYKQGSTPLGITPEEEQRLLTLWDTRHERRVAEPHPHR